MRIEVLNGLVRVTRNSLLAAGALSVAACASLPEYELATPASASSQPTAAPQQAAVSQQTLANLNAAKQRVEKARSLGLQASEAERFLAGAEAAVVENDDARAMDLASRAQRHADIAINQYYAASAQEELAEAQGYANLSREQYQRYLDGKAAADGQRSEEAVNILRALNAELAVAQSIYTVASGDSLWKIAAKDDIYGNPFWWPLIYKSNADQIADPDVINIGQKLNVRMHPTVSEVNAAVDHAHTRGTWELETVEEADTRYLNQ